MSERCAQCGVKVTETKISQTVVKEYIVTEFRHITEVLPFSHTCGHIHIQVTDHGQIMLSVN